MDQVVGSLQKMRQDTVLLDNRSHLGVQIFQFQTMIQNAAGDSLKATHVLWLTEHARN
jgi:hypothetical protein